MCFKTCQQCGADLNMTQAETHDCDWTLTPRPWQALETVQRGGDLYVIAEYLAAEIDVLRRRLDKEDQ